jgi:hypothetical protein
LKTSRTLGLLIIVLEIGGIAFLLLCGQTLLSIIGTATSGGQIPTEIDQATGNAKLTFTVGPKNAGYLPALLTIGFGVSTTDGTFSVRNFTTIYLEPGKQTPTTLTLKVPQDKLQLYANGEGTLDVYTNTKTLWNLVSLDYNVKVKGGS